MHIANGGEPITIRNHDGEAVRGLRFSNPGQQVSLHHTRAAEALGGIAEITFTTQSGNVYRLKPADGSGQAAFDVINTRSAATFTLTPEQAAAARLTVGRDVHFPGGRTCTAISEMTIIGTAPADVPRAPAAEPHAVVDLDLSAINAAGQRAQDSSLGMNAARTFTPADSQTVQQRLMSLAAADVDGHPRKLECYAYSVERADGRDPVSYLPPHPVREAYEKTAFAIFSNWRTALLTYPEHALSQRSKLKEVIEVLSREPAPRNAHEMWDLMERFPVVSILGPLTYQHGCEKGCVTSGFVYVSTDRYTLYQLQREPVTFRLYLDPPPEAVPNIVKLLINHSLTGGYPLALKYVDAGQMAHALPGAPNERRADAIVIYAGDQHGARVLEALQEIRTAHPDWFSGKPYPRFCAEAMRGVGIAHEPTAAQKEIMKSARPMDNGASFSSLRAELLSRALKRMVCGGLALNWHEPHVRQAYSECLASALGKYSDLKMTNAQAADLLHSAAFDPARLRSHSWEAAGCCEHANTRFLQLLAKGLTPQQFHEALAEAVREEAPALGIDPRNLAANSGQLLLSRPQT